MEKINLVISYLLAHRVLFYLLLLFLNTLAAYLFYHKWKPDIKEFIFKLISCVFWIIEVGLFLYYVITFFAPYDPFAN